MSREKLIEKYSYMFSKGWPSWFDYDEGWDHIVERVLSLIQWDIKYNNMPNVEILQIKEKFGRLEIYFQGGDERTSGIIDLARHISLKTCEICGSTSNIGQTKGWIKTLCKKCVEKENIEHWIEYENNN